MTIIISLTLEEEAKLHTKAARQGKDVAIVAAELLASALEWEAQDYEEAIAGIQGGLDDFETAHREVIVRFTQGPFNQITVQRDI